MFTFTGKKQHKSYSTDVFLNQSFPVHLSKKNSISTWNIYLKKYFVKRYLCSVAVCAWLSSPHPCTCRENPSPHSVIWFSITTTDKLCVVYVYIIWKYLFIILIGNIDYLLVSPRLRAACADILSSLNEERTQTCDPSVSYNK